MTTSNAKPTIVFIPGSWHGPVHYKRCADLLEANGFPTSCPNHPSWGGPPSTKMYEDANALRAELETLLDQGKDIFVVLHSYGGIVGSQAIDESLGKKAREARGLPGGVVHLLYMSAFVVGIGENLNTPLGGELPPFIPEDAEGNCVMQEPERRFYNDLPPEEQKNWASLLKKCPAITQFTPLTYDAHTHHPVSYLLCTNDQAVPLAIQQGMIAASGAKFKTYSCDTGHSPFLSEPKVVLETIKKVLA